MPMSRQIRQMPMLPYEEAVSPQTNSRRQASPYWCVSTLPTTYSLGMKPLLFQIKKRIVQGSLVGCFVS